MMGVIQRLGVKASDFPALGAALLAGSTPSEQNQLIRCLERRPIVRLDDRPDQALVIAGPARLSNALSHFLFHDVVDYVGASKRFGVRDVAGRAFDAEVERGKAFEGYLSSALGAAGVRAVDRDNRSKRPDFEWLGQQYGLLR